MSDAGKINLKETVNLPQTEFPIRAGLAELEPRLLEAWAGQDGADIPDEASGDPGTYLLHDGPPYPNGDIHMGHALNKILKDIVVRAQRSQGKTAPYVPGWDCHGLPIETQLIKQLKAEGQEEKKADVAWFRSGCEDFSKGYVATQRESFKRLGIQGRWEQPYLTLNPEYEAGVIRAFGRLSENGLLAQGRKPIHWCMHCETALAEAEIEYAEHRSPSIYVKFPMVNGDGLLAGASLLVWTTTPWTLPANVAVAVNPGMQYSVVEAEGTGRLVMAAELLEKVSEVAGLEAPSVVGTVSGAELIGLRAQHPFYAREAPVIAADFVSAEDGTGLVHIAPGHGQDDYFVGLQEGLDILMPVDDQGRFTDEAGPLGDVALAGQQVWDANKTIGMHLDEIGRLLKLKFIKHSYPHCWRCKNPVIFRATEQWFVGMDVRVPEDAPAEACRGKTLREMALASIDETRWVPDWGEKRIRSMLEGRPDWCISRQRHWGIPIPAFHCQGCGQAETTGIFNESVVQLVAAEGTAAWFAKSAAEILPVEAKCSGCGGSDFEKDTDILDVWFESGASWMSVIAPAGTAVGEIHEAQADLYLEGSDQHRGWFQSSMLIGLGTRGKAPFKEVLTHGFVVDDKGRKMSKSQGNVISPEQVIKESGADVLRWWVAGADFKNDVSVSQDILKQARNSFSKVRNTLRFLLSNLYDFDFERDAVARESQDAIDLWVLQQMHDEILPQYQKFVSDFDFHKIVHLLHDFCAVNLSQDYLDIVKDRLYCDAVDSTRRRSTQTAIYLILDAMLQMLSPILVFTTEDAYAHFNKSGKKGSVHAEVLDAGALVVPDVPALSMMPRLAKVKGQLYQILEQQRAAKALSSFMQAGVELVLDAAFEKSGLSAEAVAEFLNVSQVSLAYEAGLGDEVRFEIHVLDEASKCGRCWRYLDLNNGVCERCAEAMAATEKDSP